MTVTTYRGYKTVVVVGDETSYGDGGDADTVIKGKIQTVTINKNNTLQRFVGMGEGRNEVFVGWGNFEGTWSMEYELAGFEFLRYLIGAQDGSGTAVDPYYLEEKDIMDYDSGIDKGLKTFQMIVNSNDTNATSDKETLDGCVMNTCGLSMEVGGTLRCSLEGFFKTTTNAVTLTDFTPDTTKPWIFAQGNFKWGESGNEATVARVTNATININNNFEPDVGRELGSRFVQAAEPGLRKYDWVITVKMTSEVATTLRDHFYGQANSPTEGVSSAEPTFYEIILDLSEGSVVGDRNAQIKLSDCSINDISKPINVGDNIVELTINGAAKKGTTDTTNRPIKWWTIPPSS